MIDLFSTIDQFFIIPDFHSVHSNLWAVAVLANDVSHCSGPDHLQLGISEAPYLVAVGKEESVPIFQIVILLSLRKIVCKYVLLKNILPNRH